MNLKDITDNPRKESNIVWREPRHSIRFYLLVLLFIILNALFILFDARIANQTGWPGFVHWMLRNLPSAFLAAFNGPAPAMLAFFAAFIFEYRMQSWIAYYMFGYIAVIIVYGRLAKMRVYTSFKKIFLTAPLAAVITAGWWQIVNDLVEDGIMPQFLTLRFVEHTFFALLDALLIGVVMHHYYRVAPKSFRRFGNGIFYTKEYEDFLKYSKVKSKWSISGEVAAVIMLTAVILIIAATSGSIMLLQKFGYTMEAEQARLYTVRIFLLTSNVAFVLAGIADFIAKRVLVWPIEDISSIAANFNSAADERKLYISQMDDMKIISRNEMQELHDSMGIMMHEIDKYIEEMNQSQKNRENLQVAIASNRARSEFLSSVSHELRTPINAVLGLDEMILRETDQSEIQGYAKDIQDAGNTLLELVNDILDLSKVEAGKTELHPAEYDVKQMITDVSKMIALRAENKGLTYRMQVDPTLPSVLYGDVMRIRQVILNLLTNAVKYTLKGSVTLEITYSRLSAEAIDMEVQVIDTGIGVKEEDIGALFHPYERVHEEDHKSIEGTGLGLSIVKKFLNLMASEPEVESTYGEGSNFHFHLRQPVVDWTGIGFMGTMEQKTVRPGKFHEHFRAPEAEILMVDDHESNVKLIRGFLRRNGVQIQGANSGEMAIELACSHHYDLILMDHRMPGMDGIETLERLKGMEANQCKDTPVIALTANQVSDALEYYQERGFANYLIKPLEAERVERMLIHYLPRNKVNYVDPEFAAELAKDNDPRHAKMERLKQERKNQKGGITLVRMNRDFREKLDALDWIDSSVLYGNCNGNIEEMKEQVHAFGKACLSISKSLMQATETEDAALFERRMRALGRSSKFVGIIDLQDAAERLCTVAERHDWEQIREALPKFLDGYNAKGDALRNL